MKTPVKPFRMQQTKVKAMSDKALLLVIAILLLGVFGVMAIEATQDTPSDEIAEGLSSATERLASNIETTR